MRTMAAERTLNANIRLQRLPGLQGHKHFLKTFVFLAVAERKREITTVTAQPGVSERKSNNRSSGPQKERPGSVGSNKLRGSKHRVIRSRLFVALQRLRTNPTDHWVVADPEVSEI